MLFNSYEFVFLFFPAAMIFYLISIYAKTEIWALIIISALFYAFWDVWFLSLLLVSVIFNFTAGKWLQYLMDGRRDRAAGLLLRMAVAANLATLGWFKYAIFFSDNLRAMGITDFVLAGILLPLGISFYTFEQIGFLMDVRRGAAYRPSLRDYSLFVIFFPRVVAGPILRFNEVAPQFARAHRHDAATRWSDVAVGLTLFVIGLCKKAFLADGVAPHANAAFASASSSAAPDLFMAWGGVLAYTCQLYFDFSGYSDMAIGLARCFGIRFPANFNSPYKAGSIIEFWRRWHMTLSRFLRDYLYIPLGGNRRGPARRYANLFITMLLGGLWHGANWTFVIWGALHGAALTINHFWLSLGISAMLRERIWWRAASFGLTFAIVVIAWVFFRAPDLASAVVMLGGMAGANGARLPEAVLHAAGPLASLAVSLGVEAGGSGSQFVGTWSWVGVLLAIAWLAPNSQQLLRSFKPTLDAIGDAWAGPAWRFSAPWAILMGGLAALALLSLTRGGEFLYWQF